ncbi:GPW/gp25 family protein [Streptomyces justiciae]|uniref:GPW/gp25 family protein n=1 Tax=Streptomyces justiciae TaxID=2780140 RepID=A0ABU3M0M4_9ACTN|nr:GPW/gp25 family protein [Streptomyces justiciae]MDT7844928.1 GPW/gp25 family protein [Streptomyces justiciae]
MTWSTDPQLGRGWAFPPRWEDTDGEARVAQSEGADRVKEALRLLLRTELGSRVMRPTFGVGVERYVFEPRTGDVCHRLASAVERALMLWEPRVIVEETQAVPSGEADDRIDVRIVYRTDRHSRPDNLVLPFWVGSPA